MIPSLADIINILEYRITGGCEFGWICFGQNVRIMDFEHDEVSVVFDAVNQTVYQITASVQFDDDVYLHYLWTHPDYRIAYQQECDDRGVDSEEAFGVHIEDFADLVKFFREKEKISFTS